MLDAQRFGLPQESIEAIRDALHEQDGIWPENVAVVAAFYAVASQWRTAPLGGGFAPARIVYFGLDYAAVRAGLDAAGIAITPELWGGLRIMEAAARAALNGERP